MESLIESLDVMRSVYYTELEKLKIWKEESMDKWVDELREALGDYNNWKSRKGFEFSFSYDLDLVHHNFKCYIDTKQILSDINEKLKFRGIKLESYEETHGIAIILHINAHHIFDTKMIEDFNEFHRLKFVKEKEEYERQRKLKLESSWLDFENYKRKQYDCARDTMDVQINNAFEKFKHSKNWRISRDEHIPECAFSFNIPHDANDLKKIIMEKVQKRFNIEYDNRFTLSFRGNIIAEISLAPAAKELTRASLE